MALFGCAEIGQRPPVNQDRLVRVEQVEVVVPGAQANVIQGGASVKLDVSQVCDVRPSRVLDRTTTTESFNASPGTDWLLVGTGVVSMGAGTILVADASKTYPNDRNSRTYNETGPDKERFWGYALVGTGALLGVAALVDVVRASETTVERKQVTTTGQPRKRGVRCANQPFADEMVRAKVLDEILDLGKTDARGQLEVNLDQVIPDSVIIRGARRLELRVGTHSAGTVDLGPYYLRREAEAFRQADTAGCAGAATITSCDGVKQFLGMYPSGPHAAQALEVLAVARPRLAEMEDEVRWSEIQVEDCTKKTFETPGQILAACSPSGST